MSKLRVLYDNWWSKSATVIAASSAANALPAAASQNPQRTYVYRSLTQAGEQALDVDLGSVQAVTCVSIANVRLLSGGALKLQHRGDAGAPGAAVDVVTLPAQDVDTRITFAFFTSQSHRHWRLLWTNPGAVSDYAEAGYVFLGTYWEAAVNVRVPSQTAYAVPSVASASLDGQKDFAVRTGYAQATCEFTYAAEAQRADLRTMYRAVGIHTPFFLLLDADLAWTCWLGRITSPIRQEFAEVSGRYNLAFDWEEAR